MNVQVLDVRVIDQDMDRPLEFNIILDFSYDRTGMFDDPEIREVVQEASDDFAYFIGDMNLDEVPAGEARVWIWNPGSYDSGRIVSNRFAYTGTLIACIRASSRSHNDSERDTRRPHSLIPTGSSTP